MHTRSKHKDNNNITGEQSLNNKDTHELDHIGHKTQAQGTKEQRETTRNNKQNLRQRKEGTNENYAMENDAKKNDAQ